MTNAKICRLCNIEKSLTDFQSRKDSKDGFRNDCRKCATARMKENDRRNREKRRAKREAYYARYREQIIASRREFRARERERINARRREIWQSDPDRFAQQRKARYERDSERVREQSREYGRKRRAAIRTWKVNAITQRDGWLCGVCGEAVDSSAIFHIDHIIPVSLGGGDDLENLQLAHPSCNLAKHNRVIDWELTDSEAA